MSTEATASVPQHVLDFLGEHMKMTLATASTTGVPHAAAYMFVNDGPLLYFWARPDSATAKHIEQNPDDVEGRMRLAQLYVKRGDTEHAWEWLVNAASGFATPRMCAMYGMPVPLRRWFWCT